VNIEVHPPAGIGIAALQDVIWLFFPRADLVVKDQGAPPEMYLQISLVGSEALVVCRYNGNETLHRESATLLLPFDANEAKRLCRLAIFKLFARIKGLVPPPWGIFTGIRPTKIVHRLLGRGMRVEDIKVLLQMDYAVHPDKAKLITDIAVNQIPFLPEQNRGLGGAVGVYIGIPFCPSRCVYCSFPSYSLKTHGIWLEPFLAGLEEEIKAVGRALHNQGMQVNCVYLGGGTPTILTAAQLDNLLVHILTHLPLVSNVEFTVEGGRPETLTEDRLQVCAERSVSRISINPQTMHRKTLQAIGREHTVEEVYQAVERARTLDFRVINMDLILGLPGEGEDEVAESLRQVCALQPENITLHALAVKRAAPWRYNLAAYPLPGPVQAAVIAHTAFREVVAHGYHPYYLYRQKQMVGYLENVGYALPEKECLYNIAVIEERQTIVGLGCGGGSKWVNPVNWSLTADYNPREPNLYVHRLGDIIRRKIDNLARMR